ncbi:MAG: hypothetical protein K2W82_16040 [Candidatus Obscuribacterales bacterium]|nr:hypothetical protein [Candidatus Obscuribacterales bacterium]
MSRNSCDVWPRLLQNLRNAKGKRVFRSGWGPQGQHPVQMEGRMYDGVTVFFRSSANSCDLDIYDREYNRLATYTVPVHRFHRCTPNSLKFLDRLPKPGQPFRTKHPCGAGSIRRGVASRLICRWVKEYLASKK